MANIEDTQVQALISKLQDEGTEMVRIKRVRQILQRAKPSDEYPMVEFFIDEEKGSLKNTISVRIHKDANTAISPPPGVLQHILDSLNAKLDAIHTEVGNQITTKRTSVKNKTQAILDDIDTEIANG